jgi:hypothetical protein
VSRRVDFVSDFLDAVDEPPRTKRAVTASGRVDDLALDITRVLLSKAPSGRVSEGELAVLTDATVDEVHAAVDVLERSEIAETSADEGKIMVQMRAHEGGPHPDPVVVLDTGDPEVSEPADRDR